MAEVVQNTSNLPREPLSTPRTRRPALRWIVQTGKWAVRLAAGYCLLCILLLVVYRFVVPPITGVQLEHPERVVFFDVDPHPVASREIRALAAAGQPLDGLVPPAVARLIRERGLYRGGG